MTQAVTSTAFDKHDLISSSLKLSNSCLLQTNLPNHWLFFLLFNFCLCFLWVELFLAQVAALGLKGLQGITGLSEEHITCAQRAENLGFGLEQITQLQVHAH